MLSDIPIEVTKKLPWPPSINMVYRSYGNKIIRSEQVRKFADKCKEIFKEDKCIYKDKEELCCLIELYPPTNHRRDVDNYGKVVIDQIPWFEDDSQIKALLILMMPKVEDKEGFAQVSLGKFEDGNSI